MKEKYEPKRAEEKIFGQIDYSGELKSIALSLKDISDSQKKIAICICKIADLAGQGGVVGVKKP
jgi:hypothetical protein